MEANSVDAVITDPPYNIGFMGKDWDKTGIANNVDMWSEVYRLMKPGGHLLSFGGTRTYHRMACAIEDVGFEIRDCLLWLYGSGFPKSLDVGKAIDKAAGKEREKTGNVCWKPDGTSPGKGQNAGVFEVGKRQYDITAPATDAAKQWDGWGTGLKPAWEPIVLARKPFKGTVVNNVLKHGTGAINIDGCRIEGGAVAGTSPSHKTPQEGWDRPWRHDIEASEKTYQAKLSGNLKAQQLGRFPANLITDGSDEVVGMFPNTKGDLIDRKPRGFDATNGVTGFGTGHNDKPNRIDSGSAARFFYCAKATRAERYGKHPTVKPLNLIRYLVTLITPPGGLVLDPFAGTGTTGVACTELGFNCILIENDPEYYETIKKRTGELLFT